MEQGWTPIIIYPSLPGQPLVRMRETVDASLNITVPVMEAPLASSSSGVIDYPKRGVLVAPLREPEAPPGRETIGLDRVIADMAALIGGTLKTVAETQNALVAGRESAGEPSQSRLQGKGRNFKVDRFHGASESWVDYPMHFKAAATLNRWSKSEKSLALITDMNGLAQQYLA